MDRRPTVRGHTAHPDAPSQRTEPWLRADWQGIISRSTDGRSFTRAYLDDQKNTVYQSRALAAGYVAP